MGNSSLSIKDRYSPGDTISGHFTFTTKHGDIVDTVNIDLHKYIYTHVEIPQKSEPLKESYYVSSNMGLYTYIETRYIDIGVNQDEIIVHKQIFNSKYSNIDAYKIKTSSNLLCQIFNTYKLYFSLTIPLSSPPTVKNNNFGIFSIGYTLSATAHIRSRFCINPTSKQDITVYTRPVEFDVPLNFSLCFDHINAFTLDIPYSSLKTGKIYQSVLNFYHIHNISFPCRVHIYICTKIVCLDKDKKTSVSRKNNTLVLNYPIHKIDRHLSLVLPITIPKNIPANSYCDYGSVENKLTVLLYQDKIKYKLTKNITILN